MVWGQILESAKWSVVHEGIVDKQMYKYIYMTI